MPWRDDMAMELPGGDDHGGSDDGRNADDVRADILDELTDHLDCALNRERRATDDEAEARRRVLARFGNPRRVARRLWLDAMKGRIMAMKISIGLNVLLAIVIVVVIWMMTNEIARSRDMAHMMMAEAAQTRELLERAREEQANAPADWIAVNVTVLDESTREPLSGFEVQLSGRLLNETESGTLKEVTDANGTVSLGPIRPGSHQLGVLAPDGQYMRQSLTLLPLKEHNVEIDWKRFEFGERPVHISYAAPNGISGLVRSSGRRYGIEDVKYLIIDVVPKVVERDRRWHWPSVYVAINDRGESSVISPDDPAWLSENGLQDGLTRFEYSETTSLPSGRDYEVKTPTVYLQGDNGETLFSRDLHHLQNQELKLPVSAGDRTDWVITLGN